MVKEEVGIVGLDYSILCKERRWNNSKKSCGGVKLRRMRVIRHTLHPCTFQDYRLQVLDTVDSSKLDFRPWTIVLAL